MSDVLMCNDQMASNSGSVNVDVPGKSPSRRLDAIEWLRVLAACGVVWFHLPLGPWKEFGHAGLVAFILISVIFQAKGAEKESFGLYMQKKVGRVIPPWLAWFAIYGLINLLTGKEVFPYSSGIAADLLTGPWVGLWYLPFFMVSSVLVYGLWAVFGKTNPWVEIVICLGFGMGLLMLLPRIQGCFSLGTPWAQWLHASPALPIGMGVHGLLKLPLKARTLAVMGFLTAMTCLMVAFAADYWNLSINYGLAVLLVVPGFLLRARLWDGVTRLGSLCLGVYLIHPVVMSCMKKIPAAGDGALAVFAGTLVFSFAFAACMKKWRVTERFC
jgi:peptidoglycan/LPS O-acetylase OafA/YrhL